MEESPRIVKCPMLFESAPNIYKGQILLTASKYQVTMWKRAQIDQSLQRNLRHYRWSERQDEKHTKRGNVVNLSLGDMMHMDLDIDDDVYFFQVELNKMDVLVQQHNNSQAGLVGQLSQAEIMEMNDLVYKHQMDQGRLNESSKKRYASQNQLSMLCLVYV